MSANPEVKSASVTAESTGTDWLALDKNDAASVSITSLTSTGSLITLQRRFSGSADVFDVEPAFTVDKSGTYVADERCDIRLFCKTGHYVSGTIALRVGKG